jgi:hypothetical protein
MSKKKVQKALQALADGDLTTVTSIIRTIDGHFLKKRLRHLISSNSETYPLARQLWLHVFSESPPTPTENHSLFIARETHIDTNSYDLEINNSIIESPKKITIDDPGPVLDWFSVINGQSIDLGSVDMAHVWGLVGLSCLARKERENPTKIILITTNPQLTSVYSQGLGAYGQLHG